MIKKVIMQGLFLVVLAVVLGVGRNMVAPGGIPWVGDWGKVVVAEAGDTTIAKPASAQPDDPPFITLEQATALHNDPKVIFVDARYAEDYKEGHIPGAILLPFEMFDDYWAGVEPKLPKDHKIVTYCGGSDCEMSLFLARLLRDKGYKDIDIFYGGAEQWREHKMPMDTTAAPPAGA
jgi:rhodanese-related sulfurtransferase